MIDLRRLRGDPAYRRGIERKRVRPGLLDELLAADDERRRLVTDLDTLRARHNAASREIGRAAPEARDARIAAAAALKEEVAEASDRLAAAEARVRELALAVPNPADEGVPDGGEGDGRTLRAVGEPNPAPPLDHAAYAERMGWVDVSRAAEASGSRFAYLMREAALLELALVRWVTGILCAEGFVPTVPPVLVRERTMEEAGFFPTDRHQVYAIPDDDLYLVGTSEIPLSALHRDEILDPSVLPLRYAGFSSCFRREAGTYGTDTRGIFRVHQFDKLEMFVFSHPDHSEEELERILAVQERVVGGLGLPYRVVDIAAGDLGAAAARKIDLEVWLPSEQRWRELTSCSNYRDFSARRLRTRVRDGDGTRLVHTLNGTACAIGRTLLFLFEHAQRSDGRFVVPEVLVPHAGFEVVEPPR